MAGAAIDDILLNISPGGQMVLGIVLALIMYGVALDLRVADFVDVFRRPAAPLAGLAAQLILLPAVTWAITMVLKPQLGPPGRLLSAWLSSQITARSSGYRDAR